MRRNNSGPRVYLCEDGRWTGGPFVYFIQAGKYLKIGFTECEPFKRLSGIQSACPLECRMLAVLEGTKKDELRWHVEHERHFIRGEWFHYRGTLQIALEWLMKDPRRLSLHRTDLNGPKKARTIECRRSKLRCGGIPV